MTMPMVDPRNATPGIAAPTTLVPKTLICAPRACVQIWALAVGGMSRLMALITQVPAKTNQRGCQARFDRPGCLMMVLVIGDLFSITDFPSTGLPGFHAEFVGRCEG